MNPQYIDSVVAKGATVWGRSKWFNGITIAVPDTATYNAVMALPFVKNVTPVKRPGTGGRIKKFEDISPPSKNNNSDIIQSYDYGASFNQIHLMNGEYLHNLGYQGEGMAIAILDAGFYRADQLPAFNTLNTDNRILGTWDFVANEQSVYEDDSHGQSVLSCIAGNIPGSLVGTAPRASFYLLRSEDVATENVIEEYNWAAAAEYADSAGSDVISSSLGYTEFNNPSQNHTYADMDGNTCPSSIAADVAASKGILVLNSAGNAGNSPWHYIGAPGDADSVLAVAAVNLNGHHASFSSYGPSSDGNVKPNVAAKGVSTTVSYSDGNIGPGSGTSFSCPVLAGSAACLWQAHPAVKNMDVFNAIQQSASLFTNPGDSLGYGIPNFFLAHEILKVKENPSLGGDIIAYPNPFNNEISLLRTYTKPETITVKIFDETGRIVINYDIFSSGIEIISIPASATLSKGVYFLEIYTSGSTFTLKVVKM